MTRRRRSRVSAQVDLVPMIDIVFQLILFFLVSTTFALLPGINLNLPESTTSEGLSSGGITITMTDSGEIWFNSTLVDMNSLSSLRRAKGISNKSRSRFSCNKRANCQSI